MPTPFMHLEIAEQIRRHPDLSPDVGRQLDAAWPAFYLGNVAADYQTICDVPREQTHFYDLPPARSWVAHEAMLTAHPVLAASDALPPAQAAFVAGYCAHLLLDLAWYWEILIPYFVEPTDWPVDHRRRFLVHNTLLTYLDRKARATLPAAAGETLAAAWPQGWAPFAEDGDLIRWRDMLVRQLSPGAASETVAIYASRMHMTPEDFAANLDNPEWMAQQVFHRIPLDAVTRVMQEALTASVAVVADYLSAPAP